MGSPAPARSPGAPSCVSVLVAVSVPPVSTEAADHARSLWKPWRNPLDASGSPPVRARRVPLDGVQPPPVPAPNLASSPLHRRHSIGHSSPGPGVPRSLPFSMPLTQAREVRARGLLRGQAADTRGAQHQMGFPPAPAGVHPSVLCSLEASGP